VYASFLPQVALKSPLMHVAAKPSPRLGSVELSPQETDRLDTIIRNASRNAPQCITASDSTMERIGFKFGRAASSGESVWLDSQESDVVHNIEDCWNGRQSGIPTWAYVAGGLAAAGLLTFLLVK
jgi:hypothetical protein